MSTQSAHSYLSPSVTLGIFCIGVHGLSAQTAQAGPQSLAAIASANVSNNRTVGLVAAVVRRDDTLLMNAYGMANLEWDVPMSVDAMFEVGSIAKQFTAVAILQLRDAGKLRLEDEIATWLPEVGIDAAGVTLRHLLNHTSGIFNFNNTPAWGRNTFLPGVQRDAAKELIQLEPFEFPTGDAQAYNNSGFWLLGLVVERASAMRFEDYLKERIFNPLGMTRSMYCDGLANVARRAHGYSVRNGDVQRALTVWYPWVFAPGAVCSTAGDLVQWLRALHRGEVLSADSYEAMTTPATLNDGTTLQYGMGIKIGQTYGGRRYIGHGGSAPGFRAEATWYPAEEMAVVVLMNTSPTTVSPGTVAASLARRAHDTSNPTIEFYTDDPTPFVGTYEHGIGRDRGAFAIEVAAGPNGLTFSRNGSQPRSLPWAGGLTFYLSESVTLTFRSGDGNGGTMVELRRDDAGNHDVLRKR